VAAKNVEYTREILKTAGVAPERIQMFNCSAAEGQRFQEEVTRVSGIIENLGTNPIKVSLVKEAEKKDSEEKKKKD
jgi:coenzyme F420-reducing hydrogenase delta subunit